MEETLKIKMDKTIIEEAKRYASSQNENLSKIIEAYLKSLIREKKDKQREIPITPFVKSMETGIKIPADFDYRKVYSDYLQKKHS